MKLDNNQKAFLSLLRAGLWEQVPELLTFQGINLKEIHRLSQEQSVVGVVAAGLEHNESVQFLKEDVLFIVGEALQLEQRNKEMNLFLNYLIESLRKQDVYAILVKGQGIAQCYERPLWRACGDIDLLLSTNNYNKAQEYLDKVADSFSFGTLKEQKNLHKEYNIKGWVVELHGTMNSNLSIRIDRLVSSVMDQVFFSGDIRVWNNEQTAIYLPSPNVDIILVFVHILQHLFNGGIGLRQVCDWCRLIWCYHDQIDDYLLENRLLEMGLMSEWKAFASLAVNYLGMPIKVIPLYDSSKRWSNKAKRIISYILYTGNFGHNKNYSYITEHSVFVRKCISVYLQTKDSITLSAIFPLDSLKFFCRFIKDGLKSVMKESR